MSTPTTPQRLPDIHPGVYNGITDLVRLIDETPLSAAARAQHTQTLHGITGYADALVKENVKLREEVARLNAQPKIAEQPKSEAQ